MQESASKEKILKKVRKALIHKSRTQIISGIDFKKDIYVHPDPGNSGLDITFAQQFTEVSGKFVFCEDEDEFIDNLLHLVNENKWQDLFCLEHPIIELLNKGGISNSSPPSPKPQTPSPKSQTPPTASITSCEFLVARTGSIVISSKQTSGRRLAVFPSIHIVLAYTSQLVRNVKDALEGIKNKYGDQLPSMITTITGPSRTADIEKTLILGAHGPKELYVFLVDDN